MTGKEKQTITKAIEILLLSDRLGDAHEAGLELAKLLWGDEGHDDYLQFVESGETTERLSEKLGWES